MKSDMASLLIKTRQGLDKDKRADLEALASSKEGRRVSEMLGGDVEGFIKPETPTLCGISSGAF